MDASQLKDAVTTYIACQTRFAEEQKKGVQGTGSQHFVTISRQTGAGGVTISEKLAPYLNTHDASARCPWTVFEKNLVDAVLGEHKIPDAIAKYMPEDKISEIQDIVEEMFNLHPSQWALVHKTSETILHLAHMGNVVLVGRAANIITRKLQGGLHVRLIGSFPVRLKHIMEFFKLSEAEAKQFIQQEDHGRKEYLKKHFGQDIDNPLLYGLVLNTDFVSYDDAATIIGNAVLRLPAVSRPLKPAR